MESRGALRRGVKFYATAAERRELRRRAADEDTSVTAIVRAALGLPVAAAGRTEGGAEEDRAACDEQSTATPLLENRVSEPRATCARRGR